MNNSSMLRKGTILRGIYRIEKRLATGGFGNTYIAINTEFDERVAIKEFFIKGKTERDDTTSSVSVSNVENLQEFEEQRDKFKKEARRIRKLNNKHIIRVYDLFEENGTAYYVMDYIDGESLADKLKRTNCPMSEQEVLQILPQILDALKTVHDINLWHLDLKPANIMMDKHGQITLIDFGASKHIEKNGVLTTSSAMAKTEGYFPPEQTSQTMKNIGAWTDIYSLGATLYNLLTNSNPPTFDDIINDEIDAFKFPSTVSSTIKDLIIWMMKPNRKQRPQSIDEIMKFFSQDDFDDEKEEYDDEATVISDDNGNNDDEDTVLASDNHNEEKYENDVTDDEEEETVAVDFIPSYSKMRLRILIGSVLAILGMFFFAYMQSPTRTIDNMLHIEELLLSHSKIGWYCVLCALMMGTGTIIGALRIGMEKVEEEASYLIMVPFFFFALQWIYDIFFDEGVISAILDYLWIIIYILCGIALFAEYKGRIRVMSTFFIIHSLFLLIERLSYSFETLYNLWDIIFGSYSALIVFGGCINAWLWFLWFCIVSWMLLVKPPHNYYMEKFNNGNKYIGYHVDDQFEGLGKYKFADGTLYVGRFKSGNFHGKGTMYFKNGSHYKGHFKNDKFNGKGTYYFENHTTQYGIWKDDELITLEEEGTW